MLPAKFEKRVKTLYEKVDRLASDLIEYHDERSRVWQDSDAGANVIDAAARLDEMRNDLDSMITY